MITKLFHSRTAFKYLVAVAFFIFSTSVFSQNEFITTWQTDNPGLSNDTSITIPTFSGETYSYDVDWDNDGTFDEFGITGNVTHDFTSVGTYTIRIQGDFPRIYFNNSFSNDKDKIISIDHWGTIAWTSMENAFNGASNLLGKALDAPDLTAVTNMKGMFLRASAFNQDISDWDISKVTTLDNMFLDTAFNNGGQPLNWNTSKVTDMSSMFNGTTAFNQDIGTWDTSAVTSMRQMFQSAAAFNNGGQPLNWNTSKVTNMSLMFAGAAAFNQDISFNPDISTWDMSLVVSTFSMFRDATVFNNGGKALNWNFSVFNLDSMFHGATAFNQDISAWDMSIVNSMSYMFFNATNFNNGGNPLNWNIDNIIFMNRMFVNATAFDQNIGGWNVENATVFTLMFEGVELSNANYDALLIGWDAQNLKPGVAFDGGNSQYCTMAAQTARANMIASDGWAIADGGLFGGTCGQLGLGDNELDTILLYPNPTKDVLYIQSNNILERIKVYDINGRVMQDILMSGNNSQENISLTNLSSGLYFVNVYTSKGQITKKMIKE